MASIVRASFVILELDRDIHSVQFYLLFLFMTYWINVCGIMLGPRRLCGLMFADDLVLLAESSQDLQAGLNALQDFCSKWALSVNYNKTKVMIFGDADLPNTFVW